jgi:pyrroline-5-carboxylate reductase
MRTVGFIGYGQMNQMLIEGFIESGALKEQQIIVSNRTSGKLGSLQDQYPKIRITPDNQDLIADADWIIIGVRPLDVPIIMQEIGAIRSDVHVISLAACIRTVHLARLYPGPITRILPTVCSTVGEGVTLLCHHDLVNPDDAEEISDLFSSISQVMEIEEDLFEPAGDLTSCGPALLAEMIWELAKTGARHSALSEEECLEMVVRTMFGTALMLQEGMHPQDLIRKVATPGGITEEGVQILSTDLPPVYDKVFSTTLEKYRKLAKMADIR